MPVSPYASRLKRISLKNEYQTRNLRVQTQYTLNPSHNEVSNLFDRDNLDTSMVVINNDENNTWLKLSFGWTNNIFPKNIVKVRFYVGIALGGNVVINEGEDDSQTVDWTTGLTSQYTTPTKIEVDFSPPIRQMKFLRINFNEWDETVSPTSNDARIYGVQVFSQTDEGDLFEFNDSVLDTIAWNSSRYDGKQLQGSAINRYNKGDVSYGKTPVVRNYTRNIYVGDNIIGMSDNSSSIDDPSLVNFPDFSYATTNRFFTINEDDSIVFTFLNRTQKDDYSDRKGFYRAFHKDFPQGSGCRILLNDIGAKTLLKDRYNVFFNNGVFQKLIHIGTPLYYHQLGTVPMLHAIVHTTHSVHTAPHTYVGAVAGEAYPIVSSSTPPVGYDTDRGSWYIGGIKFLGGLPISTYTSSLFNKHLYSDWFTGSVDQKLGLSNRVVRLDNLYNFIDGFLEIRNQSDYKGDKRIYITALPYHDKDEIINSNYNKRPIYTNNEEGYKSQGSNDIGLATLSTIEVVSASIEDNFTFKDSLFGDSQWGVQIALEGPRSTKLTQNYSNRNPPIFCETAPSPENTPSGFATGSIVISKLEDSQPSLLINLNKEVDLPQDIGSKGFVLIPDNLHPHIKRNLYYFLAKAGIPLGVDTVPGLDQRNKYPDRIGWNPPKPAPNFELQAAQDAKTEITPEQRRLLARQLAEQNRKRLLEKLREEEENQRRKKRQSKREDRQEEREEKKKRREERKENRREDRQERRENRRENRRNRRRNR